MPRALSSSMRFPARCDCLLHNAGLCNVVVAYRENLSGMRMKVQRKGATGSVRIQILNVSLFTTRRAQTASGGFEKVLLERARSSNPERERDTTRRASPSSTTNDEHDEQFP